METPLVIPPLTIAPNTTITFLKETGNYNIDPDSGEEKPIYQTLECQAILTRFDAKSKIFQEPGSNYADSYVKGYIVSPNPLPSDFRLDSVVKVIITDLESGFVRRGEIETTQVITPFNNAISSVIGQPIQGIFRLLE